MKIPLAYRSQFHFLQPKLIYIHCKIRSITTITTLQNFLTLQNLKKVKLAIIYSTYLYVVTT